MYFRLNVKGIENFKTQTFPAFTVYVSWITSIVTKTSLLVTWVTIQTVVTTVVGTVPTICSAFTLLTHYIIDISLCKFSCEKDINKIIFIYN